MWLITDMETDAIQNEDELHFTTLAAPTARVVGRLKLAEEQHEEEQRNGSRATAEEKRKQAHEQYVQEGLAKFREFERRANNLLSR